MRFATRYDRWLVAVMILAAAGCFGAQMVALLSPSVRAAPLATLVLPWAIWLVVLVCMLPQYYEIREDGLFIRQGWKKTLIPYGSLMEFRSVKDARSAPVFSLRRILLVTSEGKRFVIAVAEEERFRTEVFRRCPQLNPTSGNPSRTLMR